VKASMGHVMDLPKKDLGVNIEKDFKPHYVVIPSKKDVIHELKTAAGKADAIYLAADPDREGEAICAHLRELLNSRKLKFYRVVFNEITRDAVREAFEHPGSIDAHLVEAQQARRILDRLVGYQVSPLLWEKVKRGISAGRVQTVALRLIVEREREIQAFKKQEYWTITALVEGAPAEVSGQGIGGPGPGQRGAARSHRPGGWLRGRIRDHEGKAQVSRAALHHQQAPAGRRPQTALLSEKDHDARPAAL